MDIIIVLIVILLIRIKSIIRMKKTNLLICSSRWENIFLAFMVLSLFLFSFSSSSDHFIEFKHHVIANPLPLTAWGTGGFTLADYDRDGDLNIVSKVWNADKPVYHLDYCENKLK
jgi:glucan phosphoethanolaminetransferase (alkaline phosphatase superfamily)